MTKELFLDCMKKIQAYDEWEHKLYELGINFWEREEVIELFESCINLLNYNCKDIPENKYDVSNIEYFIYDCEFGEKADKYFVTEEDGTEYHWYTAEDLWNYLVMIHPEIEDKKDE